MAKIVIIAPTEADDDVKDAVKLLKGQGHDVDTEEPTPKSLLHIVLGLLGPSAYGFGPGYAYTAGPSAEDDTAPEDEELPPEEDPATAVEDEPESDDEFHFESLGQVKVDGELIEAETIDSDISILCVQNLNQGVKTTYTLNESKFSFWPEYSETGAAVQRVEVVIEDKRAAINIPLATEGDKPVLKVGRDLLHMFEAHDDDDDISVKVGQHVKNIQPMRAGKAYASFGSPAKIGDEGKVTKVNDLRDVRIVQFKKDDGSEVYTHVQNLKR